MPTIDKRWECWEIAHNDRYIATIGNGVAVWDRASLELVHHFTGVRWIHGGIFVNNDVLMVYTGEQKIFFFQISQKKLLWAVPRNRELDSSGDMCCCHIPGTEKVACIAQGKKTLDEHYLLVVDCNTQKLSIQQLPDCYRVVSNLVWTQEFGLTFLTWQAKGDNVTILYRINRADSTNDFSILYEDESTQSILGYSGHYLFMADYVSQQPHVSVCPLEHTVACDSLKLGKSLRIYVPQLLKERQVGTQSLIFPHISWIDEDKGLLVACCKQSWVGIFDFLNEKIAFEQQNSEVIYGKILDGRLLMGCVSGFSIELLTLK